jgi:hypothetical protein
MGTAIRYSLCCASWRQPGGFARSGQRRSTRWHAITDEEGIQKRAAELAARSKTAG